MQIVKFHVVGTIGNEGAGPPLVGMFESDHSRALISPGLRTHDRRGKDRFIIDDDTFMFMMVAYQLKVSRMIFGGNLRFAGVEVRPYETKLDERVLEGGIVVFGHGFGELGSAPFEKTDIKRAHTTREGSGAQDVGIFLEIF